MSTRALGTEASYRVPRPTQGRQLHHVPHPWFQTLSLAPAIDLLAALLDPVILQELSCHLFASLSFYLLSSPQRYVSGFELLGLGLCNVFIACCI